MPRPGAVSCPLSGVSNGHPSHLQPHQIAPFGERRGCGGPFYGRRDRVRGGAVSPQLPGRSGERLVGRLSDHRIGSERSRGIPNRQPTGPGDQNQGSGKAHHRGLSPGAGIGVGDEWGNKGRFRRRGRERRGFGGILYRLYEHGPKVKEHGRRPSNRGGSRVVERTNGGWCTGRVYSGTFGCDRQRLPA